MNKHISIGVLTKYLKKKFDTDIHLQNVCIKGEISNYKAHTTGHMYFSLKDETSKINAIMFSKDASKLNFKPVEGMKVLVTGRVSVYESTGNYQIYVTEMEEDGLGNLHIAYEKLKKQLESEGLFKESYKKEIPKFPNKVGVVTAKTGAAIKDIMSTIQRRYPICEVILFPSLVQGEYAAADIVKNIKLANIYNIDVLIVGRGGGSIEDLWSFNEEIVARAIFESKIPIISAVGHEVDFTIADFVADLRAPTPTAAAELAVPSLIELEKLVNQLKIRCNESILKKYHFEKLRIDSLKNSYILKNPLVLYENKKQKLDIIYNNLNKEIKQKFNLQILRLESIKNSYILKNPMFLYEKNKKYLSDLYTKLNIDFNNQIEKKTYIFNTLIEKLEILNPLSILKRGYSITYKNEKIIKSIKDIKKNDVLTLNFSDGNIKVEVKE